MKLGFVFLLAVQRLNLLDGKYPENALQCYSSLTKPENKLICPDARLNLKLQKNTHTHVHLSFRRNYCVKETSNLDKSLCGYTQYFGDQYIKHECVFYKCSDECEEGEYPFIYHQKEYTRHRYCCTKDFCNSSLPGIPVSQLIFLMLATYITGFFYFMFC
jgi:hypothetical protein